MVFWEMMMSVLVLFSGSSNAETPVQKAFYESAQRETVCQELPCDCDCHRHIYDYRECAVCMHRGGKFAQRIVQNDRTKNDVGKYVEPVETVDESE